MIAMQHYHAALAGWFSSEMRWLHGDLPARRDRSGTLVGFPLWGEKFWGRFRVYFCASAFSGDNLRSLHSMGQVVLVLYVPESSISPASDEARVLSRAGVDVVLRTIPDSIVAAASSSQADRYPLLGAVQNLLVQAAGRWNLGFHGGVPDHVYSGRFFRGVKRLARPGGAVAGVGLSAWEPSISLALDFMRGPRGELSLSSAEVGDLSLEHLHPQMRGSWMNRYPDDFPRYHFLFWRGPSYVEVAYAHSNPTWLSPEVCRSARVSLWGTVDAQMPHFCREATLAVPALSDDAAYLEVSDSAKGATAGRFSLDEFAALTWDTVDFRDEYMDWMRLPHRLPCSPSQGTPSESEIDSMHSSTVNSVVSRRDSSRGLIPSMRDKLIGG